MEKREISAGRFRYLDGLKGIFIFAIVFFHVGAPFNHVFDGLEFFYNFGGTIGNIFFFMVSGFLISYVYKNKIRQGMFTCIEFIKKRLRNLYPTYLMTIIVLIGIQGIPNLKILSLNLLLVMSGWIEDYTAINSPCWFLSQLMLCYIIHFIIIKFVSRDKYLFILILMAIWGQILLKMNLQLPFCYIHDGEGFRNYFMGCLVWEACSRYGEEKRLLIYLGEVMWLSVIIGSLIWGGEKVAGDIDFVFGVLLIPSLLYICNAGKMNKLFQLEILQKLGKISVYIFFWHIPVLKIYLFCIRNVFFSDKIKLVLYVAILIFWCAAYKWILEKTVKLFRNNLSNM